MTAGSEYEAASGDSFTSDWLDQASAFASRATAGRGWRQRIIEWVFLSAPRKREVRQGAQSSSFVETVDRPCLGLSGTTHCNV